VKAESNSFARVYTYRRCADGTVVQGTRSIRQRISDDQYTGPYTVTGPTVDLEGWPTPAMREAVDPVTGEPLGWHIGTDGDGQIVPVFVRVTSRMWQAEYTYEQADVVVTGLLSRVVCGVPRTAREADLQASTRRDILGALQRDGISTGYVYWVQG
jgi:hypothetical protein